MPDAIVIAIKRMIRWKKGILVVFLCYVKVFVPTVCELKDAAITINTARAVCLNPRHLCDLASRCLAINCSVL
jgi:hypothetical protein